MDAVAINKTRIAAFNTKYATGISTGSSFSWNARWKRIGVFFISACPSLPREEEEERKPYTRVPTSMKVARDVVGTSSEVDGCSTRDAVLNGDSEMTGARKRGDKLS